MTRTEFLQELQDSLRGEVNPSIIQETVNYYTRYIDEAVAGGQSEQAVLESLGPARLIAKSIIEANSVKRNAETAGQTQQAQEEAPEKKERLYIPLLVWTPASDPAGSCGSRYYTGADSRYSSCCVEAVAGACRDHSDHCSGTGISANR